jgi:beta-1,3-galactosyltransferase 1
MKSRGIWRVFLLGRHDGNDSHLVQNYLSYESAIYGDLVQGDYHESYQNISLKALMGMKWLATYCSNAKLIIKFDDDLIVDFIKLLDMLSKYEGHKKTFMCQIFRGNPILRDPKTCMRWCLDPSVLPKKKVYPTHCSGPLFSMTPDLPPLLYEASRNAPFVWVDDAYLTGVLPEKMKGIKFQKNAHVWSHGKKSGSILKAWGDYWMNLLIKSKS